MIPSHDDCFNFWSIFISLPEDRKRVINVDDQRGRLFQTKTGQVPLTLQAGKELTVA